MSLEESMKALAASQTELASAMREYSQTLRDVAAGKPGQIVAAPSAGETTATEPKATRGKAAKAKDEPKDEPAKEVDPFADEEEAADETPALTAEVIRGLVLKVKEKNKDHALGLLKKLGVDTVGKIPEKDYPKVVELAAKVGVTL